MSPTARRLPSAGFIFALFCFLLPFLTVSCPGGSYTFSGIALATGASVEQPQLFGAAERREAKPDLLILGALTLTLVAGGLSLKQTRPSHRAAAASGVLAVVLLVLFRGWTDYQARQAAELVRISYELGYWLALLSLTAASTLAVAIPTPPLSPSPAIAPDRAASPV